MFGNAKPFSYSPRGINPEDLVPLRKGVQQDDFRSSSLQKSNTSRPNGKSIYQQRKEYVDKLNKQSDNFNYRVEHVFTCELDGREVKTIDDCVAKLKRLDAKERIWPQEMIMEVHGASLQLTDIETKAELESFHFSSILQTTAVLDSCAYNSLLNISVQEHSRCKVFMFQCENVGAEHIRADLDKALQSKELDVKPYPEQFDIRNNLENIIGQQVTGSFRQSGPLAMQRGSSPLPPDSPGSQWNSRESGNILPPLAYAHQDESLYRNNDMYRSQNGEEIPPQNQYTEEERNMDIFNHVLADVEIFMDKMSTATSTPVPQEKSKKKKMFQKGSTKKTGPTISLPSWEEYVSYLQKIKYGFNLLGKLDTLLTNPSAPDYVHILFSSLGTIVPQYPLDLPPSVLTPLLTEAALILLSQVVSPEEDQFWRSLGESWNIPRSQWPDKDMIPPYIPNFYDGWQLPPKPGPSPSLNGSVYGSDGYSTHPFAPGPQNGQMGDIQNFQHRDMPFPAEEPMMNSPWGAPPTARHGEPPQYVKVMYDFMARNSRELSILKGDEVEVVDKSGQWWKVRNRRGEEGHVPQNVFNDGTHLKEKPQQARSPPPLDFMSTPAEVKAWLKFKDFSKITVYSLGVLNGRQLLEMTKNEIRSVCPEEGSKVFFQLQAIKSTIALASESAYNPYNERYN